MATVLIRTNEITSSLASMVAEAGYRVLLAHSNSETLEQVLDRQPDVVILPDIAEPEDGEELLSVLRPMTGAAIVMVGVANPGRMARALFQGADSYLPHPVEPQQIRSRLRSLLRRQGLRRRPTT